MRQSTDAEAYGRRMESIEEFWPKLGVLTLIYNFADVEMWPQVRFTHTWTKIKLFAINCHLNTETFDVLIGVPLALPRFDLCHLFFIIQVTKCSLFFRGSHATFWVEGRTTRNVEGMQQSKLLLLDEISLAGSVLERINSLLNGTQTAPYRKRPSGTDLQHVKATTNAFYSHYEFWKRFWGWLNFYQRCGIVLLRCGEMRISR